ncbi:MAG TPA: hypothetical protein VN081_02670 [Dongiaceae bacterium]|nr:hypothetical protein [Dongiaceae bacterium]
MGLFQHKQHDPKKSDHDEQLAEEENFFDEYFREELRNHGRWYFEKVINENGALFKKDLEATIVQVNTDLKDHVAKQLDAAISQINVDLKTYATKQLDDQVAEYTKTMKDAQDAAIQKLTDSAGKLEQQYKDLETSLQKNIADQQAILHTTFEDNKAQLIAMKDAGDTAVDWLNRSAQALQDQYTQLTTALQKNVTDQQEMMVKTFETNMAQIVEHYLLGALGDQYDLKAQLPSIIKQLEANKEAITDDMKL